MNTDPLRSATIDDDDDTEDVHTIVLPAYCEKQTSSLC